MNESHTRWKWGAWIGGVGGAIAALCCVTPVAVIALGVIGAGALTVYLDSVLFPLLFVFVVLFAVSWIKLARRPEKPRPSG